MLSSPLSRFMLRSYFLGLIFLSFQKSILVSQVPSSALSALQSAAQSSQQPLPQSPASTTVVVVPATSVPDSELNESGNGQKVKKPQAIQIQTITPPKELSDEEKDALEEQKEIVSRFPGPNELIDYFQDKVWRRQYAKAFACIDWGEMQLSVRSKRNAVYALSVIVSRLETKDVYDYPTGESEMIQAFHSPKGKIELDFVRGEFSNWMFGTRTVRELEQNFAYLKNEPPIRHHWLMQHFPDWTLRPLWGIPTYRILILCIAFVVGLFLKRFIQWILFILTRWIFNLALHDWDRSKLTRKTWTPVGLALMFSVWLVGLLPMMPTPESIGYLYMSYVIFMVCMGIWMLFRIVDLFSLWLRLHLRHRDPNIDIIFFPLFSRTVKLLVLCFGFFVLAHLFSWPVIGLVSGLGIGGIAIAFAAKETIANLFGSVTVLADRPFVIGDWIKTGEIEGTVESVGMRSTRIRTFYNSLVTIPNNNLTTAVIDNMGARYYRRFRTYLSVPLDTDPDRIEAFCEGIRELIRRHPYTRKDLFHVYLNEFKTFSLDILLNVFFVCPDVSIEFRERGRLMADILRLAKEIGIKFALPTQIQHNIEEQLKKETAFDDEPMIAGRNAAAKVFPLDE